MNDQHTRTVLEDIYQTRPALEPEGKKARQARRTPFDWQRALAPAIIVTGVLALGVGIVQLRANIHLPTSRLSQMAKPSLRDLQGKSSIASALADATKDTDHDGLTDQEELNAYNTSPYLEDTDSDGTLDGEEVRLGADPNCPRGQTCSRATAVTPQATPVNFAPGGFFGTMNPAGELPLSITAPTVPDASTLRSQLIGSGLSADLLKNFSDQQLLEVYQEVAREQQAKTPVQIPNVASGALPSASPGTQKIPSISEFRQLLLKQGVPQATLDGLSDAELQQLMQEAAGETGSAVQESPAPAPTVIGTPSP